MSAVFCKGVILEVTYLQKSQFSQFFGDNCVFAMSAMSCKGVILEVTYL